MLSVTTAQTFVAALISSCNAAIAEEFCCYCFADMKADRKLHLIATVNDLCRREEVHRWKSCLLRKSSIVVRNFIVN